MKVKILVVEDEQSISGFIKTVLTANGYDVLLARTPGVVIGLGTLLMAFLPGYLMRFTDPLVARFSRRAS